MRYFMTALMVRSEVSHMISICLVQSEAEMMGTETFPMI